MRLTEAITRCQWDTYLKVAETWASSRHSGGVEEEMWHLKMSPIF